VNEQDPAATSFPSHPIGRIHGSTTHCPGHVAVNPSIPYRMHGDPQGHVLVYLPGLHGDFTLIRSFREHMVSSTAFVEFAYPLDGNPSLNELADSIHDALERLGVGDVTLLAESFGSQVAWAMIARPREAIRYRRLILSGGFVQYPWMGGVHLARGMVTTLGPGGNLLLGSFPLYGRLFYESRPGLAHDLARFVEARSRTEDRRAIHHRLGLIAGSDFRSVAAGTRLPVHHLTGVFDPIVPWYPVQRWLQRHCPGYQGTVRFHTSDHAVLVSRPTAAARQISSWMR